MPPASDVSAARGGVVLQNSVTVSGPIPPEYFRQLDEIDPGAGARMLKTIDDQAHHRMTLEATVVKGGERARMLGLACGLCVAVSLVVGGVVCVVTGHDSAGATIAASAAAALTGVFVYGKASQSHERIEKARLVQ